VHPGATGAAQHSPIDRHLVPIFADMFRGPLTVLLLRLGLVAAAYTVLRVLFWLYNQELFPAPPGAVFLGGLRFDASAIAWYYMPWTLLVLVVPRPARTMARIQFGMFLLVSAISLFFACVDLGYYAFSLKRSTADFLQILAAGNDTISLAPVFIRDYWHILLVYIIVLLALAQGYRWAGQWTVSNAGAWHREAGWRILAVGGLVLASRGGTQLIPLQPLDAARYGGSTYLPVVLNTPFTMLLSLGKPTLAARTYMPQSEADALWPVVQELPADPALDSIYHQDRPDRPNVVIIILESFSALYSAELAGGSGHMPFLDSLMRTGINCTEAYANGRRSIDGIPAVLAGMPQWMDEAFITSPYAGQPFTSLASVLGAKGYRTSFYHGGRNGTMGFDGFVRGAGFSSYHGLDEYPASDDFDGHWGIRDRPYLRHHAQQMAAETEPFLSAVFTLSSHHPYELPPEEAARFGGTNMPIQATLRYTDDALRGYFGTVRTMPWYRNTLFVITADHTADLERNGSMGNKPIDYWVPLIYHAAWLPAVEHRSVTQHIDILPTVLDLVGHDDAFFAFGHSMLRKRVPPVAIWSNNGIFTITGPTQQVQFDGERVIGVLPLRDQAVDPTSAGDLELHLQAAIQQYNKCLLGSTLTAAHMQ
jgi:phosphoglycerol transferase MdoB-like AlkP superfamily enzyme